MENSKEKEEKKSMSSQDNEKLNKKNDGSDIEKKNFETKVEESPGNNDQGEEKNENKLNDENIDKEESQFNLVDLLDDISNLEDKIVRLETEKEEVNKRLQRLQADFSNYRKRSEKEMGRIHSTAVVEVIKELLPVLDNFERALEHNEAGDEFRKGVNLIYRQLMDFLGKNGIEVIETIGNEFDHNYHNAVMQVESDEFDSGIIVGEMQKGYILEDIVIRPSMVKVAE